MLWHIVFRLYIYSLAMEWDWTIKKCIFMNASLFLFCGNLWHGRFRFDTILRWLYRPGVHLQNKIRFLVGFNPMSLSVSARHKSSPTSTLAKLYLCLSGMGGICLLLRGLEGVSGLLPSPSYTKSSVLPGHPRVIILPSPLGGCFHGKSVINMLV